MHIYSNRSREIQIKFNLVSGSMAVNKHCMFTFCHAISHILSSINHQYTTLMSFNETSVCGCSAFCWNSREGLPQIGLQSPAMDQFYINLSKIIVSAYCHFVISHMHPLLLQHDPLTWHQGNHPSEWSLLSIRVAEGIFPSVWVDNCQSNIPIMYMQMCK